MEWERAEGQMGNEGRMVVKIDCFAALDFERNSHRDGENSSMLNRCDVVVVLG